MHSSVLIFMSCLSLVFVHIQSILRVNDEQLVPATTVVCSFKQLSRFLFLSQNLLFGTAKKYSFTIS
jgi:hypothetical protein